LRLHRVVIRVRDKNNTSWEDTKAPIPDSLSEKDITGITQRFQMVDPQSSFSKMCHWTIGAFIFQAEDILFRIEHFRFEFLL